MADDQKVKEKMKYWRIVDELEADKEMYRTELNDAMKQFKMERLILKQQLNDSHKEIRIKDKALAQGAELLIEKQMSLDDAVSRHSDELEELQRVTQEQVLTLQKSIVEKDEELVVTSNELSDLHRRLAQQSDMMYTEIQEKQAIRHELTDKKIAIDMLQANIAKYKVELNDAKDLMSQLKLEQLSMKQKLSR